MNPKRGYYSLVQYCPDHSRLEAANVGVVLFCPELSFIEARTSKGNDRPRRFFSDLEIDLGFLNSAKKALEERIQVETDSFKTVHDLQHFVDTRGNELVLTSPRPVKVFEPQKDMEKLYEELVGGRKKETPEKRNEIQELELAFQKLHTEGRAKLNWNIEVPITKAKMHIPYVYQNGSCNLVKPENFGIKNISSSKDKAIRLSFAGDLLRKYPSNNHKRELIVVPFFDSSSIESGIKQAKELRSSVSAILEEYKIETIKAHDMPDFIRRIEEEAHPW